MEHDRSNEAPLLDEEDTQRDTPMPSRIVTERDDARSLQKITGKASLIEWANETVGGDGGDQYRIEPSGGGTQFTGDKHNLTMLHI
jgi:hypothetical protein